MRGVTHDEQTMGYVDDRFMEQYISRQTVRDYPYDWFIEQRKYSSNDENKKSNYNSEGTRNEVERTNSKSTIKYKRPIDLENIKKWELSDVFRRIQEESRRLSSSISQQERVNSFDESLYERIRGI